MTQQKRFKGAYLGAEVKEIADRVCRMEQHYREVQAREAKMWTLLNLMECAAAVIVEGVDPKTVSEDVRNAIRSIKGVKAEVAKVLR